MDSLEHKQPFEVELPLPVRTYDIDFAGIVSNIVYVRWLEDLRLEMLARHFPLGEQLRDGFMPVVVQTKVDYKQPVKLGDVPVGKMWMQSVDSLRWTVNAAIAVNGKTAALGEQMGVFVSLQTNRPIRMPASLKQQYQALVAQPMKKEPALCADS
ncbi:acyl-CoA thioesterase [Leptolyngbya sp. AN02str]|uniref:acyl-CoA thioesterase n=1 Tax=Leptolyngbya sp. AN02str TaxID=3423363 RepID=UPI003D319C70